MTLLINENKNKKNALNYNLKQSFYIPIEVYEVYPGLKLDRSGDEFYEEVRKVQLDAELGVDGIFGPVTQQWLTRRFTCEVDYLVIKGERVPINTKGMFSITDFTENSKYDLHKFGNFSRRKGGVSKFVMHHGGYNIDHLAMVFSTNERKVSTHIGMGIDEKTGKIVVAQYLDLNYVAWHAGGMNEGTVGIDFAIQPTVECADRYKLPIVDNPTKIGPKKILLLPDSLIIAMAQLLKELHKILKIEIKPFEFAEKKLNVIDIQKSDISIIGHHHFATNGKFDISYIWDRLYLELTSQFK